MNNIKRIFIITSSLFIFTCISCKKGFLDRDPLDSVSNSVFWKTEADVETALAGVYSRLQSDFLGYQRVYLDGLSDNAFADPGNAFMPNIPTMTTGGITPGLKSPLENMYSAPYKAIASSNYFLDNIDKAPIGEDLKNRYRGEARFIRALSYFDLVRLFGNVVIYDHFPTTIESAKIAGSPIDQVYKFINDDLDAAISSLPSGLYHGHAVKASAQGLKARVLMTQKKWSEAVSLLNEIISSQTFDLSDDYAALFTTEGQNNPNVNKEVLFSTQYLAPNNIQHSGQGGMDIELGWFYLLQPYSDLIDDYEMEDGKAINESPLYNPDDPYANRDPRLDLSIKLPNETWFNPITGNPWDGGYSTSTGYVMEKYVDLSRAPFNANTSTSTDQDYIHLRYADILLMYAEAQNEVSGPDATVYDAIDQVRGRNGINMPHIDQTKYSTQEELRDVIRHERRVEFALEGSRYFDLKRWEIAHIKLPTIKTPAGVPYVFEQKNYLLPFPQSETDNNPQLDPNPDY